MLYSGIDLHKRTLAIHTLDAAGTLIRKADLPTHRAEISAYFASMPGPHQAVVECTGMWYWLRDLLVAQGIDLRLGHAKYLKAISYAKVKTDAVDAATLAQLLRVQLVPEAHMIGDAHREIRDVLRARLLLVGRSLRCQRSVGALLEKYNVATPAELPELPRLQAELHTAQRALLATHVRRLERELRERVLVTPDAQRLIWVPGIGKMVAYTLLLEIDDIHRFPTVRHFHSYCRLVPGSSDSGARPGTNARATATATSRWPFIMPRSARSSISRKSAPSISTCSAAKANPLPARSSRRNSRRSCTPCSRKESTSMARSVDTT